MQRIISNNDMNNLGEGLPVLDSITRKFLQEAFKVLSHKEAIVITGSCVVALPLRPSFLPGDIDVFVKQDLKLEDQIFDHYILVPLSTEEGIPLHPPK
jgi:hypothetical protein